MIVSTKQANKIRLECKYGLECERRNFKKNKHNGNMSYLLFCHQMQKKNSRTQVSKTIKVLLRSTLAKAIKETGEMDVLMPLFP